MNRLVFRRLRHAVSSALNAASVAIRGNDDQILNGFVEVVEHRPAGDVHIQLGKNVLTETARLNVSRILAGTAATVPGVTFPNDEGAAFSGDLLPRYLWIGTGTAEARADDEGLETRIGTLSFPLSRVKVYDSVAEYGGDAPFVTWEFDIPAGPLDVEPSPITINEWLLVNNSEDQALARKVKPYEKDFDFAVTVRWHWRT